MVVTVATLWPLGSRANVDRQRHGVSPSRPCADPWAGVWVGHKYNTGYWYRLRLEIERVDGEPTRLDGRIDSRFWAGEPEDGPEPFACAGQSDVTVTMEASGQVRGETLSLIGADRWSIDQVSCGPSYDGGYIPDGFIGGIADDGVTLDTLWFGIRDRTTIHHTRDWKGDDANYLVGSVRFRRVECEELEPPMPELDSMTHTPPPSYRSGCMGCF